MIENESPGELNSSSVEESSPYVPRTATVYHPDSERRSKARERVRRRRVKGNKPGGEWAWLIIGLAAASIVIVLSLLGMMLYHANRNGSTILPTAAANFAQLPPLDDSSDLQLRTGQSVLLENGHSFILEPWDGTSRYTVLFMGLDRRPDETGLAYRTDTMILISMDPATNRIGVLSIPRDLYVAVPGFSQRQQVNTTLALGEGRQPGTGPELAMATLQYNLGIRVHDYIIMDFEAVVGLIDAVGGIDVTIDYTIDDPEYPDMNYGFDPFYLPAGTHHLSGRDALKFARTRHGDSDYERAARQQQVLFSLRDRVLNFNMIPQLIIQSPALLNSFDNNVYTSLNLQQIIELAWYIKDLPQENITTGVIDFRYLLNQTTGQGIPILIPNHANMGEMMVNIFGANYSE